MTVIDHDAVGAVKKSSGRNNTMLQHKMCIERLRFISVFEVMDV